LSEFCCKTVDYDKTCQFIVAKRQCAKEVDGYYRDMFFRATKWRTRTYQQKSEAVFFNKIEHTYGANCVLAIGN